MYLYVENPFNCYTFLMGVITIPLWLAFFLILGVFFLLAFAERGIFVEFLKSFLFKTI